MNEEQEEFCIPKKLLDDVYELSGDADTNKGLILAVISERGTPMIYSRFDSVVIELALKKTLQDWDLNNDTEIGNEII
jgi:hypothetical protein|tara:strand:- start:1504 stop:1737 length:234 start_codon:yes stop_codon:yes gene_type:complete